MSKARKAKAVPSIEKETVETPDVETTDVVTGTIETTSEPVTLDTSIEKQSVPLNFPVAAPGGYMTGAVHITLTGEQMEKLSALNNGLVLDGVTINAFGDGLKWVLDQFPPVVK